MKKLITIICAICLISGCAIQKNPKREYYTLLEIQSIYGLKNNELKAIAKNGSIESFYHCEKGRMYKYTGK